MCCHIDCKAVSRDSINHMWSPVEPGLYTLGGYWMDGPLLVEANACTYVEDQVGGARCTLQYKLILSVCLKKLPHWFPTRLAPQTVLWSCGAMTRVYHCHDQSESSLRTSQWKQHLETCLQHGDGFGSESGSTNGVTHANDRQEHPITEQQCKT